MIACDSASLALLARICSPRTPRDRHRRRSEAAVVLPCCTPTPSVQLQRQLLDGASIYPASTIARQHRTGPRRGRKGAPQELQSGRTPTGPARSRGAPAAPVRVEADLPPTLQARLADLVSASASTFFTGLAEHVCVLAVSLILLRRLARTCWPATTVGKDIPRSRSRGSWACSWNCGAARRHVRQPDLPCEAAARVAAVGQAADVHSRDAVLPPSSARRRPRPWPRAARPRWTRWRSPGLAWAGRARAHLRDPRPHRPPVSSTRRGSAAGSGTPPRRPSPSDGRAASPASPVGATRSPPTPRSADSARGRGPAVSPRNAWRRWPGPARWAEW